MPSSPLYSLHAWLYVVVLGVSITTDPLNCMAHLLLRHNLQFASTNHLVQCQVDTEAYSVRSWSTELVAQGQPGREFS